jgi:hypothetical protein
LLIKAQRFENLQNKLANLSKKGLTIYYDENYGPAFQLKKVKIETKSWFIPYPNVAPILLLKFLKTAGSSIQIYNSGKILFMITGAKR